MADARRIVIATPTDGRPETALISYAYHMSVRQLERAGASIIPSELFFSDDLARARSRAVRHSLERDNWDWILWIDDDVSFDSRIVPRMVDRAVADGHDVLGAPYPRKRIPTKYPYKALTQHMADGQIEIVRDCIEVELIAFGFVLTSRRCLQAMTEHYAHEWFTDTQEGQPPTETVGLFKQVHTDEVTVNTHNGPKRYRELLGEDYSFCYRWRAMGGKVQMYIGEGAPLSHVGGHAFTGTLQDLGNV